MRPVLAAGLLAGLALTAGPAAACRQALALGLDVSGSVDAVEYRLQTAGLAAALMAPEADWDALLRSLPGMALLLNVNLQDPQYSHLAPCPPVRRAFDHACTIGIALEGDFNRYWQGRSRHLRQNLGRYQRR